MLNQSAPVSPRRARKPIVFLALSLLSVTLAAGTARAQWTTTGCDANNVCSTNTGNVGIGTGSTAPTERLVVNGNVLGGQVTTRTKLYSSYDTQANSIFELGYRTATSSVSHYASFVMSKNITNGENLIGGLSFANSGIADESDKRLAAILAWSGTSTTAGNLRFYTMGGGTFQERMRLDESGNLGLGTTSPASQLHVDAAGLGSIRVSGGGAAVMNFEDKAAASGQRLYQWRSEGGAFRMSLGADDGGSFVRQNILVANSAGNVGFGTASPNYALVVGPAMSSGMSFATLTVSKGAGQSASVVAGAGGTSVGEFGWDQNNGRAFLNAPGTTPFAVTQDGSNVRLYVSNAGNVGVGTTAPSQKLEIVGGVKVSKDASGTGGNLNVEGTITGGTISATYQDVAEWVPSTQKLAAGTVVVLDATRTNHVLASTAAYDTKVAGVVSAAPGVILGSGGEGKVKVATTGRVKVKVDATRAPIKVGDLLVTSGTEGIAMKSIPVDLGGTQLHRPGTIIGKALEPLESGTGEILVLLSLQ